MRSESRRNCGHTGGGDTETRTEMGTGTQGGRDRDTKKGGQRPRELGQRTRERGTETQSEGHRDPERGKDKDGQMGRHSVQLGRPRDMRSHWPTLALPRHAASHCWPCGQSPGSPGPRRHQWASPWCASHCPKQSPRLPRTHPPQPLTGGRSGDAHTGTRSLWGGGIRGA